MKGVCMRERGVLQGKPGQQTGVRVRSARESTGPGAKSGSCSLGLAINPISQFSAANEVKMPMRITRPRGYGITCKVCNWAAVLRFQDRGDIKENVSIRLSTSKSTSSVPPLFPGSFPLVLSSQARSSGYPLSLYLVIPAGTLPYLLDNTLSSSPHQSFIVLSCLLFLDAILSWCWLGEHTSSEIRESMSKPNCSACQTLRIGKYLGPHVLCLLIGNLKIIIVQVSQYSWEGK